MAKAVPPVDPQEACSYLNEERFRGTIEYKENNKTGIYSCSSLRRSIDKGEPLGSDLKYQVSGDASEARKISLQLRMNSYRIAQPVLREFEQYAMMLYEKLFGESLPEEISRSILSAVKGEWILHDHNITLERVHDRARVYELIFSIEK